MLYRIRKPGRQLGEPLLPSGHRDPYHFRRGQKLQKDRLGSLALKKHCNEVAAKEVYVCNDGTDTQTFF